MPAKNTIRIGDIEKKLLQSVKVNPDEYNSLALRRVLKKYLELKEKGVIK